MLGVFAEFETNLRRERQAKVSPLQRRVAFIRGGRPGLIQKPADTGMRAAHMGCQPGISRGSVYRFLRTAAEKPLQ